MSRAHRGRVFVGGVIVAAFGAGCSLIVSSTVAPFHCTAANGSCPSGFVCEVTTEECVAVPSDGEEAAASDDDDDDDDAPSKDASGKRDASKDATPDTAPSLRGLGEQCGIHADCKSNLCGSVSMLTDSVTQRQICTKTCCTSADCDDPSFVCFGTGTGGNYCVRAASIQRPKTGAKPSGQACSTDAECRSGDCRSPDNKCSDTCCVASDCTNGMVCGVQSNGVSGGSAFVCRNKPTGTKGPGASCSDHDACESNLCLGFRNCSASCSSTSSCQAQFPGGRCAYNTNPSGQDAVRICYGASANPGTKVEGEACSENIDCTSGYCDFSRRVCMDVCAEDSDCPTGKACRPTAAGQPLLRCEKR